MDEQKQDGKIGPYGGMKTRWRLDPDEGIGTKWRNRNKIKGQEQD